MYKKNLNVLKTFHPEVAEQINNISGLEIDIRLSDSGIPNLYVKNNNGLFEPCYPEPEPLADLEHVYKHFTGKAGYAICVLGAGLCLHVKTLIDRFEKNCLIVLMEAYPQILSAAMTLIDLTDVFSHPQIRIVTGDNVNVHDLFLDQQSKMLSSRGYSILEFNGFTSLAPDYYNKVKEDLHQFFIKRNESKKVIMKAGDVLFSNRFKNLFSMYTSSPVEILKNRYKNCPIIIVGSGPSLEKNINKLTDAKGAVIIAVDSAVAPLIKHQITPDYVVTTDFRDFTYEKLAPFSEQLKESRLIFFVEGTPIIPAYLTFAEMYYLFIDSPCIPIFNQLFNKVFNPIRDAQSVIHGALCIAQLMGGGPIIFTGLDLALDGEKDHAEGTVLHWGNVSVDTDNDIFVEGFNGQMVKTMPGFIAQKEICEQLIQQKTDTKYIDSSEGGVKIYGTDILPLAEVITEYCLKDSNSPHYKNIKAVEMKIESLLSALIDLRNENLRVKKSLEDYFSNINSVKFYLTKNPLLVSLNAFKGSIKKKIRKMDTINTALNDNRLILALKELQGKSYQEYLEHTFDEALVDSYSAEIKQLLLDIRQQGFVQKIRLDAVETFSDILDQQIEFFMGLNQIENSTELEVEEKKMRLGKYFYKHTFLSRAESLFAESDKHPESEFFLGAIKIKKGQVEIGQMLVNNAIEKDNSLKLKYERFIQQTTEHFFNKMVEGVSKEIIIDRILKIDPKNKRAYKVLKKDCMNKAFKFLEEKKIVEAEHVLSKAWLPEVVTDISYLMLFLLVSLQLGKYEQLLNLFKIAKYESNEAGDYIYWCRYWLNAYLYLGTEWVDGGGLTKYVSCAYSDETLTTLLQVIWGTAWQGAEAKLKKFHRNSSFTNQVDRGLDKWAVIKDVIPEWYLLRALNCIAKGDNEGSLKNCNYAINVGRFKKTFFISHVEPLFVQAWTYCEQKQYSKALLLIEQCFDVSARVNWWVIWLQLKLKNDSTIELKQQISEMKTIDFFKPHLTYYNGLEQLKEEGCLEPLISEIMIACDCPIRGEQLIFLYWKSKEGLSPDNVLLLRNIIFDIRLKLSDLKTPILIDFINMAWQKDLIVIEKLSFEETETLLTKWKCLNEYILGWDYVYAEILIKHNRTIEALTILDRIYGDNRNNIEFLKMYILQLFLFERTDDAILIFEELLSISPESVYILKEVGDNYFTDCNFSAALTIYEECLSLMPESYDVLFNVGDIYFKYGNFESAVLAFETLLLKEPDHDQAKKRLMEIEDLRS